MAEVELVTEARQLRRVVDELLAVDRYAIDTEFHRERTYFAHLALVQIAWEGGLALIDPLAVDLAPLGEVFRTDARAIMHAARQDLEVLWAALGRVAPAGGASAKQYLSTPIRILPD